MKRISSIDATRGIVMIIMALDHVRDLMHVNSITQSPTNLASTTPILFFTRWITYLCAPTFVFLAGTSAFISFKNRNSFLQSRKFLLKRGLYLVILEFVVVNLLMYFDPGYHTLIFEVIATIGFGFMVLSFLLKVSSKTLAITSLAIIFCHNLFSLIPFEQGSVLKNILTPLLSLAVFPVFTNKVFIMAYPPIPWLGIMLAGFATGKLFELQQPERKKLFIKIGLSALLLFVVIRFVNIYGDPVKWTVQNNDIFTFLSFMNITKYPPSLLFCLITLGIMFLMLAFTEGVKNKFIAITSVYGKVPLFYFLVHFFLIHVIMVAVMLLQGFHWPQLDFASGNFGRPKGVASGLPLWGIYLIWIFVVAVLYKPCVWYGKYKSAHKNGWVRYL
jgi:uncharacterized membrane protein